MLQTLIGAGIGAIISLLFYLLARNRSRINYQTSNLKIIGNLSLNLPQDFEVTLSGEKIESLYKSQIIIWNGGTTTIDGSNIVKDDPLRIVFSPNTKIFNIGIVGETRKINKFSFDVSLDNQNVCNLTFDFLDKKDGVVLEILHTKSPEQPKIRGTVKGLVNGIKSKGQVEFIKNRSKLKWKWFLIILGIILVSSIAVSIGLVSLFFSLRDLTGRFSTLKVYMIMFTATFITSILMMAVSTFEPFKKKYPKSLKFKE
jgi:hypothetical protein